MSVSRAFSKVGVAALGAVLGLVCLSSVAEAGTVILYQDTYSGANGGGAFRAQTSDAGSFYTFCMEVREDFSPGSTYQYDVSTNAISGDVASPAGDPISNATAWLYTQFRNGTLHSYLAAYPTTYPGSGAANTELQKAFWQLEDEPSYGSYSQNHLTGDALELFKLAIGQFGGGFAAGHDGDFAYVNYGTALNSDQIGNVRVMNLYTVNSSGNRVNAQSQLTIVVPLPSAALAGLAMMAGLGAVTVIRRRRSQTLA